MNEATQLYVQEQLQCISTRIVARVSQYSFLHICLPIISLLIHCQERIPFSEPPH